MAPIRYGSSCSPPERVGQSLYGGGAMPPRDYIPAGLFLPGDRISWPLSRYLYPYG